MQAQTGHFGHCSTLNEQPEAVCISLDTIQD